MNINRKQTWLSLFFKSYPTGDYQSLRPACAYMQSTKVPLLLIHTDDNRRKN